MCMYTQTHTSTLGIHFRMKGLYYLMVLIIQFCKKYNVFGRKCNELYMQLLVEIEKAG